MVHSVECLPAKLQHLSLGEFEILNKGGIHDEDPWPDQGVAAHVSEGSEYLGSKCAHVEEVFRGLLTSRQHRINSGDCVRAIEARADVGCIASICADREWKACLIGHDGSKLPTTGNRIQSAVLNIEVASFANRDVVEYRIDEPMRSIKDGERTLATQAVTVLRKKRVAIVCADGTRFINRLRPRVGNQGGEAAAVSFRQFSRETVIVAVRSGVD